jgi:hypothetical protein
MKIQKSCITKSESTKKREREQRALVKKSAMNEGFVGKLPLLGWHALRIL